MKVYSLNTFPGESVGWVATIGMFDGVHCGHRYLIEQVKKEAALRRLPSAVLTFTSHPRQFFNPSTSPFLLSTKEEKITLLASTGIDRCLLMDFNEQLANLPAREFIREILHEKLRVKCLIIGHDNHFGKGGKDSFEDYVNYGKEVGIEIVPASAYYAGERPVSSSLIRGLLLKGKVELATRYLGHPYSLQGKVIKGFQVGRTIDFPTANMALAPSKLLPAFGAYAVEILLDGQTEKGMLNIGRRPTVHTNGIVTIEVHLFNYTGILYGRELIIRLKSFLRPEYKFNSKEELQSQLYKDKEMAWTILSNI